MMKYVYDNVKLSCGLGAVLSAFLIACSGCFSSTRYTATLHPNQVKSASHITGRYRVAKVLVNELEIIKFVRLAMENGWLGSPDGYNKFNSYAEKNGIDALQSVTSWHALQAANIADLEKEHKKYETLVHDSLNSALVRLYPTVFSNDGNTIPLTIMISMEESYKIDAPFYYPNIAALVWPLSADQETKFDVLVLNGNIQKDDKALRNEFDERLKLKRRAKQEPSVVRASEVWETMGLPIGLIPIPGESQWSRKMGFMAENGPFHGKDRGSLFDVYTSGIDQANLKALTASMKRAYIPEVDSEVLAAAVVQELNKMK
jgi:hypothetical protein